MLFFPLLCTYVVATCIGLFYPKPYQVAAALDAANRGWHPAIVAFTRAVQHYTNFCVLIGLLANLFENRELAATANILGLVMFVLYHGICMYDATLLGYDQPERILKIARFRPPLDRDVIIWAGLHMQHTLVPLSQLGYVEHYASDIFFAFATLAFYIALNSFCWRVQGVPAYPIQETIYRMSKTYYNFSVVHVFTLCGLMSLGLATIY